MNDYRKNLKSLDNQKRYTFTGTFVRTGFKHTRNYRGVEYCQPTLMLKDVKIKNHGKFLADHLWLNYSKNFLKLGRLTQGNQIQFDGRINIYEKKYYMQHQTDYKISRPTKVQRIDNSMGGLIPIDSNNALIGYILLDNWCFYQLECRNTMDDQYYIRHYEMWCHAHEIKPISKNQKINC